MNHSLLSKESVKWASAAAALPVLLGISGCPSMHALSAGSKYAEAYGKIGALVEESGAMAKNADRRSNIAARLSLYQPTPGDVAGAVKLLCPDYDANLAKAEFSHGNMARYKGAIEALAKSPEDSFASIIASIRKSLPTDKDVLLSEEDFKKKFERRQKNCMTFIAESRTYTPASLGASALTELKTILDLLKTFASQYEKARRVDAYKHLVLALDQPVQAILKALNDEVSGLLHLAAKEAITSVARDSSPSAGKASPQSVERALDGIARFERAFAIHEGIYLIDDISTTPLEKRKTAFTKLADAHAQIVEAAKAGRVTGADGLDDLLALLTFVGGVKEKVDSL